MTCLEAEPLTRTASPVAYGPLQENGMVTAGLDFYKPTMSQFIYEQERDTEATLTFKNRGEQRLLDYVDPVELQARLDGIRDRGFNETELEFLANHTNAQGERMFSEDYLDHLRITPLPTVDIRIENDDLAISATGEWATTSFWETIIMSEVNELYFENYVTQNGIDLFALYEEGDRRLTDKIAFLQQNPDIKVAEFGTRRRFSLRWQKHVTERMQNECPNNLIGTSNVALASTLNLKPIGTFAHELPMGYAGLADARGQSIRESHGRMLDDWYDFYGDELAIALSDTFGSAFFFEDFSPERSEKYRGTRHDSGDPVAYGRAAIAHYQNLGIDPTTKTVLFSDGLNVHKAANITEQVGAETNAPFGIGTDLTNDLGLRALNVVMKLTRIKDVRTGASAETVKLSDNPGKHTGPAHKVAQYKNEFGVTQ